MKPIVALVLSFIVTAGSALADQNDYLSSDQFDSELAAAHRLVDEGMYTIALKKFEALATERLFEVPNYEPYYHIAYSHLQLGDVAKARENLRQFKCMLRVDSGVKKCSNATDYKNSTPSNIVKHQTDFSELQLCYETMCYGIYFSYYDEPTAASLKRIEEFWNDVHLLDDAISVAESKQSD